MAQRPACSELLFGANAGAGHWVVEEQPGQMLAGLSTFLTPYRDLTPAAAA
jgi:hypothetical protein